MKYLLILLFVVYSAAEKTTTSSGSDDHHHVLTQVDRKCTEDCGPTSDELKKIDLSQNVTDEIQCYINCFMVSFGAIKDGKIQLDKLIELVGTECTEDKTKIIERVQSCKNLKGDNDRDTSVKVTECIYKDKFCATGDEE